MFLGLLYLTGSVTAAARDIGMTRQAAHRLRSRAGAESFARAWDRVLAPPGSGRLPPLKTDWRKVTIMELRRQAYGGLVKPVLFRGKVCAIRRKSDNTALLRLLRREDAMARRITGHGGKM